MVYVGRQKCQKGNSGLGLFAISALMAESVLAQDQAIRVVVGTYGGNCNAPHGNKTEHLAAACNGRADCTYKIDYP